MFKGPLGHQSGNFRSEAPKFVGQHDQVDFPNRNPPVYMASGMDDAGGLHAERLAQTGEGQRSLVINGTPHRVSVDSVDKTG